MIDASAGPQAHDHADLEPPPVVAIVGPTAAGKTALSLTLAHRLGGEVVNADSMQLYRGMDIGTAKLRPDQREGIAHHALDLWDVTEPASVAEYQRAARAAIDDVRARGRTPLLVGGSGLYVRAVLERFEFPGTDEGLRARLEAELAEVGPARLHARLAGRDPEAAARILPSNGRRIVRALEVIELTGRPFEAALPDPTPYYPAVHIGVDLDPPTLDERVATRVDHMWELGLADEVRELERQGLRRGRTASRALGYQQVLRYLAGECSLAEARDQTVQATRRFVRRQRSWFRRDQRIVWLDGAAGDLAERALAVAAATGKGATGKGATGTGAAGKGATSTGAAGTRAAGAS
jgi:tRNA dimethylallyltransferase